MTQIAGTLDAWTRHANMLFAPGCEAQAFFLLSSFAAPLYGAIKEPGAGLVSIWGGKKSGKSVALAAAGSAWGRPADFNIGSAAGDDRYRRLKELDHLPAIHDTMARHDPSRIHRFLHDCMEGEAMKLGLWRGSMLAISPVPLFPVFAATNQPWPSYGVEFEVSVPKELIDTRLKLEQAFLANTGHAGEKYTAYLVKEGVDRWCRQQIISRRLRIEEERGIEDKKARFAQTAIAAAHVAGFICVKLGLLDYDVDRITEWAAGKAFSSSPA